MKKILLITIILSAFFSIYVKAEVKNDKVTINYLQNGDKSYDIIYNFGRIYVPFEECCKDFGIKYTYKDNSYILSNNKKSTDVSAKSESNKPDMIFNQNKCYIYLYNIIEPFGNIPVVNIDNNRIDIYKSVKGKTYNQISASNPKSAYIRLEDVMADGMDKSLSPSYTTTMLEELRYTAEYLYNNGQSYYIAWIPVYANPKAKYWNDVSANYNLYNAYFVYTLDYMLEHNGHLGLHGYTHQYGNDISAIGYEWGSDTPYSVSEQENRIKKAIKCAENLGLKYEFFEFPHYGATTAQLKMASKYFDLIYQSYPSNKLTNVFTYTAVSGKKVYYMPTPANYLHTKYDLNNMLSRINNSISNKYTVSLFYHPVIDDYAIREETSGSERIWHYGEGTLPQILKYISSRGYRFSPILK